MVTKIRPTTNNIYSIHYILGTYLGAHNFGGPGRRPTLPPLKAGPVRALLLAYIVNVNHRLSGPPS
jgi:hypothetical protein